MLTVAAVVLILIGLVVLASGLGPGGALSNWRSIRRLRRDYERLSNREAFEAQGPYPQQGSENENPTKGKIERNMKELDDGNHS